jgi:hypothetical protein
MTQHQCEVANNRPKLPFAMEASGIGLFSYIISPSIVLLERSMVGFAFIEYLGGVSGAVVE